MEPKSDNVSKPSDFGKLNKLIDSMQVSRANDSGCYVSPEIIERRKCLLRDIKFNPSPNDFRELVTTSDNFIDKSELIEDLERIQGPVIITRPRRWGKTLNLGMIKSFYEIDLDSNGEPQGYNKNKVLFEGGKLDPTNPQSRVLRKLKIANNEEIMAHQGKFPVIFITFPKIDSTELNPLEIEKLFRISIRKAYLIHSNIYKKKLIERIQMNYKFNQIKCTEVLADYRIEDLEKRIKSNDIPISDGLKFFSNFIHGDPSAEVSQSLEELIIFLYDFFKKQFIVIIDEYDAPLSNKHSLIKEIKSNRMLSYTIRGWVISDKQFPRNDY